MHPKCPWCGKKIWTMKKNNKMKFTNFCGGGCYESKEFDTPELALAAAAKWFMPKRSVEEIETFCEKLEVEKQKQWKLCVRDKNMSMGFMEFLKLMQFTRIADYINGVTE